MSDRKAIRVERGIYYKKSSAGGRLYEIRWRDSAGISKRRAVGPRITEARAALTVELAKRGRGEPAPRDPRLTFGDALDGFFANRVADLRETSQAGHRWAIERHLRPRFGNRRMDRITADDWAGFIRACRREGLSEGSIAKILRSARGAYRYAARRLDWTGRDTLSLLERRELPSPGDKLPHRLYTEEELAATLRAATGQYRVIFALAGTLGSRISETLGLVEEDLDLADLDQASITFTHQITRRGKRVPLKTRASRRTIEIPRSLAVMLDAHLRRTSGRRGQGGEPRFVFCSLAGRALSQRNVTRELRRAMRNATYEDGRPVFPVLSQTDDGGRPIKIDRGVLPSFHSFRHTAASQVIADGDGAEEASWMLGHADSTVTRRVYIEQIASAERSSRRRGKLEARMGATLSALGEDGPKISAALS